MRDIKRRPYDLIPLSDKKKIEEYTQIKLNTLRNWRSTKKYPELFLPIGGKIFLDKRAWQRMLRKAKQESIREAKIVSKDHE